MALLKIFWAVSCMASFVASLVPKTVPVRVVLQKKAQMMSLPVASFRSCANSSLPACCMLRMTEMSPSNPSGR